MRFKFDVRTARFLLAAILRNLKVAHYRFLWIFFKFDSWHINARNRPNYVETVHKFANMVEDRNVVMEIGCGLGNLIKGCNFDYRIALDNNLEVVRAAKFLNFFSSTKVDYFLGSFEQALEKRNVNLLILVNWIHNVPSGLLEESIARIIESSLSLDSYIISEGVSKYQFYHNKIFFSKFGEVIAEDYIDDREIFLIQVHKH